MSEPDHKESCCAKCKTNWALTLSIVSLALNLILITALIVGAHCHKKRSREFHAQHGGVAGLQCPAGGHGGLQHQGTPGAARHGLGSPREHHDWQGADRAGKAVRHLVKELELDADQQAKVKQIIDEQKARWSKLDHQQPANFKQLLEEGKAKIHAVLKSDQQKKFDELVTKFERRHNKVKQ
ncbi:MAG: hypothetical protein LBK71_10995 [Verrucomicrobiales bacterium]|nr:hypothetical protein [Verrucomicrobiales bacterium]